MAKKKRKSAYAILRDNYDSIKDALEDYARWWDEKELVRDHPDLKRAIDEMEAWDGKR